ncbi:MAG: extracellular solute-binding protein [Planctomycetes bacterium]|nr:extracellular solute-binding protein [Planctomycetota bacterium]
MAHPLRSVRWLAAFAAACTACVPGCGSNEEAKRANGKAPALLCHVGGTMRPVMEELAKRYKAETGGEVQFNYGDSGALLTQIEQAKRGDLYVCHDPFGGSAQKKGLADRLWTVASLTPTIAVPKGNPKGIHGLRDLAKPKLRLGLTDEMYSTLGHINPLMFDKAGLRKEIEGNVVTRTRMGGEVANAVAIGNLDATIAWNAVIHLRKDKLEAIPIEPEYLLQPGVDAITTATFGVIDMGCIRVTISRLNCSKQPEAAAAFAQYAASEKARAVFAEFGFSAAPAGATEAPPETATVPTPGREGLHLYCGAGIRPAVAEAIQAFEKEAKTTVRADYGGSGTLLSNIRASKRGDLYMPGESEYVDRAESFGLIASRRNVCYFIPVILVTKGNPKGIKSLQDLTKPGLRLGLGNPDACAIGQTCVKLFQKNAVPLDAIEKNTRVKTLTVNELGVQVKMGQIDATIVWDAIAAYYADSADAVAIPRAKNIVSQVAISILNSARDRELAMKFVSFLAGPAGQAIFQKHHYTTSLPAE